MICYEFVISYKTSTGPKPLSIMLDKIDEFIWVHGREFKYLVFI